MPHLKILFAAGYILIAIATVATVLLTRFSADHDTLLAVMTAEKGPFEIGSAVILLILAAMAFTRIKKLYRRNTAKSKRKWHLIFMVGIGIMALLAALEELSWGQHLLGFESSEVFAKHNYQKETNLHNFIPAVWFGLAVNASVYLLFIFIPLLLKLDGLQTRISQTHWRWLLPYTPSLHIVLMFCFACSLQAYFKLETLTDTLALIAALLFSAYISLRYYKSGKRLELLHWIAVIVSAALMMLCHEVFSYQNMQYEIREFIYMFAFTFWFSGYSKRIIVDYDTA